MGYGYPYFDADGDCYPQKREAGRSRSEDFPSSTLRSLPVVRSCDLKKTTTNHKQTHRGCLVGLVESIYVCEPQMFGACGVYFSFLDMKVGGMWPRAVFVSIFFLQPARRGAPTKMIPMCQLTHCHSADTTLDKPLR